MAVKILFDGVEGIQEDMSALIFVGFILHGWAASSRGDTLDLLIITLIVILLFVLKSCPISGDRSH